MRNTSSGSVLPPPSRSFFMRISERKRVGDSLAYKIENDDVCDQIEDQDSDKDGFAGFVAEDVHTDKDTGRASDQSQNEERFFGDPPRMFDGFAFIQIDQSET
jgi:hypothetical protein